MTTAGTFDTDVLIAGAGPVGKTLACELARHGVRFRLVDGAAGPKDISKALILHSRTQEVQELMGVLPRSQAQSNPLTHINMHAYGQKIAEITAGVDGPYPHALILGQDRTERILEAHLQSLGGSVDWHTALTGFMQDGESVTATLRRSDGQEETVRARYLVGCEGSDSVVRKSLNLQFSGDRYEGEQFIQADCKIRWTLPSGVSYLFLTREGYMMVIEMPDDIVRIFISLPDPDPSNQAAPTLQEVQDALNELGQTDALLSNPVWLARYRTSHRYADRFREGRAFIAGDAAHIHVPLGGQGMNTGIQDAFNLAWKLAYTLKGQAHPALLDTYNAERHPVAAALIEGTNRGYTTILHPKELTQQVVRRIGPFVMRQAVVQEKLQNVLQEMNIAYSDTPLAADYGGSRGPKAGERAPDAVAVRLADCATVRVFDLLHGTHWLLLLFCGPDAAQETGQTLAALRQRIALQYGDLIHAYIVVADTKPPVTPDAPDAVLMDTEHFLHDRYDVRSPCLYLIRPDDYVGFRGKIADEPHLTAYLQTFLIAPQP